MSWEDQELRFDGPDDEPDRNARLGAQFWRIFNLMKDAAWRTLEEISVVTGDPPASISAQLRHMRKKRFGRHTVLRRHSGGGLYHYQLTVNEDAALAAVN